MFRIQNCSPTFILFSLLIAVTPRTSQSAEIKITYQTLQKALMANAFTDKSRFYIDGDSGSKCKYAYLEEPSVSSGGGRIHLKAHFSGRAATRLFGECIGPGDAFDVFFSGEPYADGESIGLRSLRLDGTSDSNFLRDKILDFVRDQLPRIVSFNLGQELRRNLIEANKTSPYKAALQSFEFQDLRAEAQHLVMKVDLRLSVSSD